MPIDKSYQRKHYNNVIYHNNKWTTESYKFLHLGWSSMEGCWWGPHRTCQSAALWCTTGAQQKVGDESRRDIPVHIHAEQFYFFPFLARTLHSFHNWKDIALEIICIFQFIHCTRLKTNDEGKHIPMDESLGMLSGGSFAKPAPDTNLLEAVDWKFALHQCEGIRHSSWQWKWQRHIALLMLISQGRLTKVFCNPILLNFCSLQWILLWDILTIWLLTEMIIKLLWLSKTIPSLCSAHHKSSTMIQFLCKCTPLGV